MVVSKVVQAGHISEISVILVSEDTHLDVEGRPLR